VIGAAFAAIPKVLEKVSEAVKNSHGIQAKSD